MDRRAFLGTMSVFAAPLAHPLVSEAQRARPPRQIGCLTPGDPGSASQQAFRRGLRELGYVEGETILLTYRFGAGSNERLEAFARELVGLKVEVLFTTGTEATAAGQAATTSIPIVSVTGDPVGSRFVSGLARPGGNITGLALLTPEMSRKWLDVVRETLPRASRVAVLQHREDGGRLLEGLEEAARQIAIRLIVTKIQSIKEISTVFETVTRERADAIMFLSSPALTSARREIVTLSARHRLAAVYEHRQFVDDGGLISYGPQLPVVFHRAAAYVDKILRGAKPADLPVEQPTTFELVINLKTAKALGLTIPSSLLARADEVIQ